jgi:hypothetical protein
VEEHEDWLLALREIMLDIPRAVDFLARVTNRDLKIESGAVVLMGQGYVSRTAEVWNTTVSRRMLTARPAKQVWWVDGESDEGEAERDPANTWITDTDMCDCLADALGCGYWRGCVDRTITERRLRGGCHCANSYQLHKSACNTRYNALSPLIHRDRASWLAANLLAAQVDAGAVGRIMNDAEYASYREDSSKPTSSGARTGIRHTMPSGQVAGDEPTSTTAGLGSGDGGKANFGVTGNFGGDEGDEGDGGGVADLDICDGGTADGDGSAEGGDGKADFGDGSGGDPDFDISDRSGGDDGGDGDDGGGDRPVLTGTEREELEFADRYYAARGLAEGITYVRGDLAGDPYRAIEEDGDEVGVGDDDGGVGDDSGGGDDGGVGGGC